MVNIYEKIFVKLRKLGVIDLVNNGVSYAKSESSPFMDLHFDLLSTGENRVIISLAHTYIQNGDVMTDPDMEIEIHLGAEMAEALTFQQANPPLFQRVYSEDRTRFRPKLKKHLNTFLNGTWLNNLLAQGHKFEISVSEPDWSLTA